MRTITSDYLIDINEFTQGLQVLEDTTDAPIGSARIMQNMAVTDRGGIGPRPGTAILGTWDAGTTGTDGFYNFLKSGIQTEIPIKASNGELKYYHPTLLDWWRLSNGYTPTKEFGFKEHLINTDNEDYLYFGNGVENYSRWNGGTATLNGAFVSGTVLTVDSTLKSPVYESGTSTSTTTTSVTDTSKTWASKQWVNFYVVITSGAQAGQIRIITDSGSNFVSFGALPGDPIAGCTYQFRLPKFAASGSLKVGNNLVVYSAIPTSTSFTITDPSVGIADKTAVTQIPTTYAGGPRGNRFENHHTRMLVGGVNSGVSRDASGNLQGSQSTSTLYVSKIKNATDFTFSNPRVAGEGDIISFPFGGGNIQDVVNFEDSFAVFKKYSIDLGKYSTTDSTDVPAITPLKQGYGSANHVVKGRDDIYFVTMDKQITSIGRVQLKDTVPQTTNIGLIIKRLLDTFDFSNVVGHEFGQRILFSCKTSSGDSANNQIIVYNKQNKSFEGIWYLTANQFDIIQGKLYAGDSISPNIYQLFTSDHNDVRSSTVKFGIDCSWRSNWIHLVPRRSRFRIKPTHFAIQGINTIGFEGYVTDGTIITFSLFADFNDTAALQFNFGLPADSVFLQGADLGAFLGSNPLGLEPLGTISDPNPEGIRHFKFIIYFPDVYCNYLSVGVDGTGSDQSWELMRIGLGTSEESMQSSDNIKSLT